LKNAANFASVFPPFTAACATFALNAAAWLVLVGFVLASAEPRHSRRRQAENLIVPLSTLFGPAPTFPLAYRPGISDREKLLWRLRAGCFDSTDEGRVIVGQGEPASPSLTRCGLHQDQCDIVVGAVFQRPFQQCVRRMIHDAIAHQGRQFTVRNWARQTI
jgi:hypothetical protein